jgi:hypothetical protein
MQVVLAPERLLLLSLRTLTPVFIQEFLFFIFFFFFSVRHSSFMYLSAHQDDVKTTHFSTATTTSTLTSTTSALRDYHLHVVLVGFYSSYNICVITTLQLRGDVSSSDSTFDLFSSLIICGAPTMTAGK